MNKQLKVFERGIVTVLMVLMVIVLLLSVVELGWLVVRDVLSPPVFLMDIKELLELFGFFLLVLIGVELLETIKTYFVDRAIHVEVVVDVALIAIARKVVILDVKEHEPLQLVGIALIVIALAVSHFLVKHRPQRSGPEPAKE